MNSSGAASIQLLTQAQMTRCLDDLRDSFDRAEIVARHANRAIVRWRFIDTGQSVIVKLWSHRILAGTVRRLLGVAPPDWEWRNLIRLDKAGMPVPRPLGRCVVEPRIAGYADAVFMEDLGNCELSTDHLKRLIQTGQEHEALRFEDTLIEMAERLAKAGLLDVDHGLANIVVQGSSRTVRLDLELARPAAWARLPQYSGMYGEMVGRLIGLHAFAVQPDVARSTRFAARVCARLQPNRRTLEQAGRYAHRMMRKQREEIGIDTRLELPWDV
jgi:hypothetical protein